MGGRRLGTCSEGGSKGGTQGEREGEKGQKGESYRIGLGPPKNGQRALKGHCGGEVKSSVLCDYWGKKKGSFLKNQQKCLSI